MANCKGKNCKSAEYRDGLSADEKQRYEAKLSIVGGLDPYEGKLAWSDNVNILPAVTYPDIVNYLLFTPSAYSADDLKAYKSLDAYNQFVSGWVREKSGIVHGQYVVVTAKVLHSQRMREKPLRPWVIVEKDGKIVAAHCNCMAGLGEACTHVAALLFSIEATVKIRDSKTVTQEKAYWLLPSDCKTISYKEINEINFVSARTAKKKLDKQLDSVSSPAISETPSVRKTKSVPEASFSDFMAFAEKLSKLDSKPAILSLIEPYSDKYVPKFDVTDFPSELTDLKNDKLIGASLKEILEACSSIQVHCSKQQAENVELHTQSQSKSKMWFKFRAGRITASKAKAICTMDKENPSQSLIKSICYPETNIFQSAATKWGLDQEKRARDVFVAEIGPMHDNSRIEDSGFIISTAYPAVGASPDGIFVCDCCGSAVVEIKCPYNIRKEEINADNCKYLTETEGNQLKLKKDHQYFYQIQTQLGVTNMEMAYFVVWTEKSCHIETIMFEESIWNEIISESNKTFRVAILPELVGKYFTTVPASVLKVKPAVENIDKQSVPSTCNSDIHDSSEKLYCLCSQVEHGDMIACDNSECTIEWFHYRCVNIEKPPKGKWYCPNCRKLPEFKRRRIAK